MLDLNLGRLANLEYEERLREAALYRHIQTIQSQQPSWFEKVILSLSQLLIDTGTQLKQRVPMRPSLS